MRRIKVLVLIIWICMLAPEVLYEPDIGCIGRTDGKELTQDEVYQLIVDTCYSDSDELTFKYKLKISELFRRIDKK